MGNNDSGQFGLGNTTSPIMTPKRLQQFEGYKKIAYDGERTALIDNSNNLWVCGDNSYYVLGLSGWEYTTLTKVNSLSNVEDVIFGYVAFMQVKTTSGELYGAGIYMELGGGFKKANIQDTSMQLIANGNSGNFDVLINGKLYGTWYDTTSNEYVVEPSNEVNYEGIEAIKSRFMSVYKIDGKIYLDSCPDVTQYSQQVITTLRPIFDGVSYFYSLAGNIALTTMNGEIYDDLTTKNTTLSNIKIYKTGRDYCRFAITKDGELYFSSDQYSYFGNGVWNDFTIVKKNENEDLTNVKQIYTGLATSIVILTEDNEIYWAGMEIYSAFPDISDTTITYPQDITNNGAVLPNIKDKIKDIRMYTNYGELGLGIVANTLIVTTDGELYTMCKGNSNMSGVGHTNTDFELMNIENEKIVEARITLGLCFAVTDTGEVYAWGYNEYGLMGDGYTIGGVYSTPQKLKISNIKSLEIGDKYAIFIGKSGEIYGVGDNAYGQLRRRNNNVNKYFCKVYGTRKVGANCVRPSIL